MSFSPPIAAAPRTSDGVEGIDPSDGADQLKVQQLYREHSSSLLRQLTRK